MKNTFTILILFCCQASFAQRHQQLPDRQKVIHVLQKQEAAWNRGDIEEYMHGYWQSDSLIFIGKKDVNRGWRLTLESYKKAYPSKAAMGKLKFDLISVDVLSPAYAHVIGKWTLKRSSGEAIGGHFTLLFRKISNAWVIICDHTS